MPSLDQFVALLPQKAPFVFVDAVDELRPLESVVGRVTFAEGHRVFEGHLPGEPLVPGVIVIEALAQISGLVLLRADGGRVRGYLARVDQLRFHRLVRPGETIRLASTLTRRFGSAASFDVTAEVVVESAGDLPAAPPAEPRAELVASGSLTLGGMTEETGNRSRTQTQNPEPEATS